jgi:hypothetical protein
LEATFFLQDSLFLVSCLDPVILISHFIII